MSIYSFPKADTVQKLDFEHHQVIEASAGTGKTYTIEQIIIELILEKKMSLSQILLVTYTEKAATELKSRVRSRLERMLTGVDSQLVQDDSEINPHWTVDHDKRLLLSNAINEFDSAFIGTIHSFCARMTKEFALVCFLILDPKTTHDTGFTKFFLSWIEKNQNQFSDLLKDFVEFRGHSKLKKLPNDILSFLSEQGTIDDDSKQELIPKICEVIANQWKDYKQGLGVWTFDDMLSTAEEAASQSLFVDAVRQRFQYVIVDEFQDTDPKQWNIFKKLFACNTQKLFVIGDPKQAIYRFKGGDVETYQKAKKELLAGRDPIVLNQNFRSTPLLIYATNQLFQDYFENVIVKSGKFRSISFLFQDYFENVIVKSGQKQQTQNHHQTGIKVWKSDNEKDIAEEIAKEIQQLLHDALLQDKEKIAILVRTKKQGKVIAKQLEEQGIPYSFYKQDTLFQTSEAKDIYYFLQALIHPENQYKLHLTYLFNPKQQSIQEVRPAINTYQWSHWNTQIKKGEYTKLFQDLFQTTNLAKHCALQGKLERLHNYQKIVESVIDWSLQQTTQIDALSLILKRHIQKESQFTDDDTEQENATSWQHHKVLIMTIHASKGLEFSHVFLFGLWHEKKTSDDWSILHDEEGNRKIYFESKISEEQKKKLQAELNKELLNLIYVGCTRAKNVLYFPILKKEQKKKDFYVDFCKQFETFEESKEKGFDFVEIPKHSSPSQESANLTKIPNVSLELEQHSKITLKNQQKPLRIWSYTSLSHQQTIQTESSQGDLLESDANQTHDDFSSDSKHSEELPKGTNTGNFLHEALENVNIANLKECWEKDKKNEWEKDFEECIQKLMQKHGIKAHLQQNALDMVWEAWTQELPQLKCSLCQTTKQIREPRFFFQHQDKQLLNGAIDFVFEHDGLVYFVDWKSNLLEKYDSSALKLNINKHYALQIKIYSQAISHWLHIDNEQKFEQRLGGCFYIFLRGLLKNPVQGIYFDPLSWQQIQQFSAQNLF